MTFPLNIIINSRIWYDSRILDSDPVVYQNVNYVDGSDRSVNVVRQRYLEDFARRTIPNSIRQGVGLTDPVGASDIIAATQGYAIVAGRFMEIPTGDFEATSGAVGGGGLTGSGGTPIQHYLVIKVTDFTEADDRNSNDEEANIVGVPSSGYSRTHNELVIAKFRYNGSVIDQFIDYTAEMEWQASVISPVSVRPTLTTGSDSILLRAGQEERVNILGIETDKTRFYLNAVFDDQDGSPVEEVKLINNLAVLEVTDVAHDDFLGMAMFNLSTGTTIGGTATERIDELGNLLNIGDINGRTIGENNPTDIVDVDSTQTMTNKTLTAPTITDGTYAQAVLDLPEINDSSDDHRYIFAVNELTLNRTITLPLLIGDDTFVFEDHIQTMVGKTLTTPVIASLYQDAGLTQLMTVPNAASDTFALLDAVQTLTNKTLETLVVQDNDQSHTGSIVLPNLSANVNYIISATSQDTFVFQNKAQSLSNKTFILPIISAAGFTNAQHTHIGAPAGGYLNTSALNAGILPVARGGTNVATFTSSNRLMYSTSSTGMTTLANPGAGFFLSSQTANPLWRTLDLTVNYSGDLNGTADTASFNSSGDMSITLNPNITDNSHSHYMHDVGLDWVSYSPRLIVIGEQGAGNIVDSTGDFMGVQQVDLGDGSGNHVAFNLPIFANREINQVNVRIQNIDGDTRTFYGDVIAYWDNGTNTGLASLGANSINHGNVETLIITDNWTLGTSDDRIAVLRLWSNSSSVQCHIIGIRVQYSSTTGG